MSDGEAGGETRRLKIQGVGRMAIQEGTRGSTKQGRHLGLAEDKDALLGIIGSHGGCVNNEGHNQSCMLERLQRLDMGQQWKPGRRGDRYRDGGIDFREACALS